jgi:hypothetical protein
MVVPKPQLAVPGEELPRFSGLPLQGTVSYICLPHL